MESTFDASGGDELQMSVGRRVRALRVSRDLSIAALSNAAHVDPSYLGELERGRKNVSLLTLHRISAALGVAPKELFEPHFEST